MASMVFSISLPPEIGTVLERLAEEKGSSVSKIVQDLVVEKDKKNKEKIG